MDLVKRGYQIAKDIPELNEAFFSISANFGKLIFATRLEQKLTQQELANRSGLGVKTIHRIEGGGGGVTDTTYEKVFSALGITANEIESICKKKSINTNAKVMA